MHDEEVDIGIPTPFFTEHETPGLKRFYQILRRQFAILAVIVFASVSVTGIAVLLLFTPSYTANGTLLIERQPPQVLDIKAPLAETQETVLDVDHDYYKTQYEILESRTLAARVLKKLGIQSENALDGEAKGFAVTQELQRLWSMVSPSGVGAHNSRHVTEEGEDPELIDAYLKRLEIVAQLGTRLVRIGFSSTDPALAARIVNAHIDAYTEQEVKFHSQAANDAWHFLEQKAADLRGRVEKSEEALNQYRRERGIVTFSMRDKGQIVMDRISGASKAVIEAKSKRIALEEKVRLNGESNYEDAPAVIENPLIQQLKLRLAAVSERYANMASRYKPGFPLLVQVRTELEETRRSLNQEARSVFQSLRENYKAAAATEADLQKDVEEEKRSALELNDASLQDAVLARDVDANRELYKSVLDRLKQMQISAELRTSNVSVVDWAQPPLRPARPRKFRSLLLSGLLSALFAMSLILLLEHFDDTLNTPEEVEHYLGVPNLGRVPDFLGLKKQTPLLSSNDLERDSAAIAGKPDGWAHRIAVTHHPFSAASEAYRIICTGILLSRAEKPPKTILITSATQAEGKTTTAINLAVALAQMGDNVVLTDADLRHPRCDRVLRINSSIGLTTVLTGQGQLAAAVTPTAYAGLSFFAAGPKPPNPGELLRSRKMHNVLEELSSRFDFVILDSAPVLPVADAAILSASVDGLLLVVGPQTPKQQVRAACARLRHVGAKVLGVVLNQVDPQGAEYSEYNRYYSDNDLRAPV